MNTNLETHEDLDPCLDEQEIRAYASGEDTGVRDRTIIRSHLEVCPECRANLESHVEQPNSLTNMAKRSIQRFRDKQEQVRHLAQRGPVPGTIWRAKPNPAEKEDRIGPLVVILDSTETPDGFLLTVAEVSEALDRAIDSDILLNPRD